MNSPLSPQSNGLNLSSKKMEPGSVANHMAKQINQQLEEMGVTPRIDLSKINPDQPGSENQNTMRHIPNIVSPHEPPHSIDIQL